MCGEEVAHTLRLVRRKVVKNDMYLFLCWSCIDHFAQEVYEFLAGMPMRGLSKHFACLGVQGDIQRERTVAIVFEAMPLRATRRERQHRVESIQRLNGGLLIDTENSRML